MMNNERGSALIITILVMVVLTLLGISFLLMANTENQIAKNELHSAQALQAAESGVRMVKRWFDKPFSSLNVSNPTFGGEIELSMRLIDVDGDPATPPVLQDGGAYPQYKQGVDLDGDGNEDLFEKPYRGSAAHAFMGTEDGPDMRILEDDSAEAADFLEQLSADLFGAYPDDGLQARIRQIDIYGPPYIEIGGVWTRYGMATVKVIARIYQIVEDDDDLVLAERTVKAVINEMPYPGPYGPLHSCNNLSWNGDFNVHWGTSSATGESTLSNNHASIPVSWPRVTPPGQREDALWTADWANYMAAVDGEEIEDPWFRYLSGGPLDPAPGGFLFTAPVAQQGDDQPWAFDWTFPNPVGDGHWPNHDNNPDDGSHSNIFQNQALVTCPEFDYEMWKSIATSGGSDVHYLVWDNGISFKENGVGTSRTFQAFTDNQEGVFFFDTIDGVAPHDDDGNGTPDNLTPMISITGGIWGARGFIYLNALTFQTRGCAGRAAIFNAPGEPYSDSNANGTWDAGDPYINLAYPTTLGDPFTIDTTDTYGGVVMRNDQGPNVLFNASMWGILVNSGHFEATGNALFYGSIVAKSGVGLLSPAAGTPELYWDESIVKDWPPSSWDLPRVMITKWETDL